MLRLPTRPKKDSHGGSLTYYLLSCYLSIIMPTTLCKAETDRAWRLRAVAIFGPFGAPVRSFRQKIAGTKVRRSSPPAGRGWSPWFPDAPPLCGSAVARCAAGVLLKSQNCVLVRGFRRFMRLWCLEQRSLLGKSCAPARSFRKDMLSSFLSIGLSWAKTGLSRGAFAKTCFLIELSWEKVGLSCGAFAKICFLLPLRPCCFGQK